MINPLLLGAISMTCFVAGMFFIKFWKATRDRFFLFFSFSFLIEGLNRILMGIFPSETDRDLMIYSIRAISYLLILIAIIDKNRRSQIQ